MKIEQGHPLPGTPTGVGRPNIYPFKEMKPGDSVWFDSAEHILQRVRVAAYVYGRNKGWKFATRTEGEGLRVWRVN